MKIVGFFVSWLLSIHIASVFGGILLKHLSEQRPPGGFLEILKKPKIPGLNIQLPGGGGGFSVGASIGSFGFGFGFGGHYVPPGTGVNVPPKEPHYPHVPHPKPGVPDLTPHEPGFPDPKPHVPDPKPHLPGGAWEEERGRPRPNWEEYEEEYPKRESYEKDEVEYPKYTKPKEDTRPDWEDIGETNQDDPDSKSENFMNGELIKEGLIQPRLNRKRNKRYIESHVYHVPLTFRSNAKPFQVKVLSNLNSLVKDEK